MSEGHKKSNGNRTSSRGQFPPKRGLGPAYGILLVLVIGVLIWGAESSKHSLQASPLMSLVESKRALDLERTLHSPEGMERFLGPKAKVPLLSRQSVLHLLEDWFERRDAVDDLVVKRLGEYAGASWVVYFRRGTWRTALPELFSMFDANPIGFYRLERSRPNGPPLEHVDFSLLCSPLTDGLPWEPRRLDRSLGDAWRLHEENGSLKSGPKAGDARVDRIEFGSAEMQLRRGKLVFFLRHALLAGALAVPFGPGMQLVLPAWNGDGVPYLVVQSGSEQRKIELDMPRRQASDVPHDLLVCVDLREVLGRVVPESLRVALDGRFYEWEQPLPTTLPQVPKHYVPELRNYGSSRFVVDQFEIAQLPLD